MHDHSPPRPPAQGAAAHARPAARGGRWLVTLFALPFALGGWGTLLLGAAPSVYGWARAQAWQATPAQLTAAELVTHHGKGTTYSVNATYRYRVQGTEFTGSRVALSDGPDNVGDFHEALGRRLGAALQSGTPVTAWVNPDHPQQAVLDRSLRPGLLALQLFAALLFGGFGSVLLWRSWRSRTHSR